MHLNGVLSKLLQNPVLSSSSFRSVLCREAYLRDSEGAFRVSLLVSPFLKAKTCDDCDYKGVISARLCNIAFSLRSERLNGF